MKRALCLLVLMLLVPLRAACANPVVQEVTSPHGIKAWLVEDHTLPVIAIQFAFQGGVEQDPADKQGLAVLASGLLTQGAGPYDEAQFQTLLADNSLSLGVAAGRDRVTGSLKTLRETRETGFRLLRLALTQPRFDAASVARAKDRMLARQKAVESQPEWQARRALFSAVWGDHPYAYRSLGTPDSIAAIAPADLKGFVRRSLATDGLMIGVSGAISSQELGVVLDQVFGKLPAKGSRTQIKKTPWPEQGRVLHVKRQGTQVDMAFAVPSVFRDDPDFVAAEVANYILGGGSFSSRVMKDLRDRQGLTYGVRTSLAPMEEAALLMGSMATEKAKAQDAWASLGSVWKGLVEEGPSDEEVEAAKSYLMGAMPLALTTTDAMAGYVLGLQIDHLGKDYMDRYPSLVQQVSTDRVRAVLRRAFDPARLVCVMVGGEE